MIWQAFADVACISGHTLACDLHNDFASAKRARLHGQSRPFLIPVASRLRRVAWLLELGVEADAALVGGPFGTILRVAVLGADRRVDLLDGAEGHLLAGTGLAWVLVCSGLDGRATFTFDFEADSRGRRG